MSVEEGTVEVPGAALRYRLVRAAPGRPVLVFENGWGASYHYWAWVQRELAGYAQLLFYNRAGIGGSTRSAPQTPERISAQFGAMLDALRFDQPVIVVGQSYGGLMCALHAAQVPQRLRGLVQVDGTAERPHPVIDQTLGMVKVLTRCFTIPVARLGLPDPLYGAAARLLPPEDAQQLMETAFGSVASLRAALAELELLPAIRAAIARGVAPPPRLAISAGRSAERKGVVARLIASEARAAQLLQLMEADHQAAAAKNGTWKRLPHDHGGLVFTQAGARDTAAEVLAFARSLA